MLVASSQLYSNNPVGRVLELLDGYAHIIYGPGSCQKHRLRALSSHTAQFLRPWHKLSGGQRLMTSLPPQDQLALTTGLRPSGAAPPQSMGYRLFNSEKGSGMVATIAC